MSTDANAPVTTSQIGRLNPIDFESSGKVKNRPITSALQAFEIYQRFERDNLLRANKNKDLSDAYNGSPPFDQTKLNNVGQRWRANWSRNMLASVVNRVKNRFIASINGRKYLTASKLPNSFPNGASKSELYQEAITKLLRQWTGFRDFLDKLIQEDVLFGYTGSFHLSDTDWRPRTARQEELLMDEQTPQCADQLPIFVVKMDYYLWEITNMIEDRGAAEDEGFQIDNLEWACRMAYPPRMNLAYDPRQLSDMVREANIYYTYHKSTNVVQTAYVFVTNFTGGVDCWWVNRSQAIGQRLHEEEDKKQEMARGETREGSRDTEDDADDPEDREGILLRYTEDFARNMQDVITLFTLESGNNRYFGSKGLGRYLYNPTYAQDRVFCLAQDKIYAESLIWGKIDSANVARMGMEVRNPFGVFPDGFEPSKDHQFEFDPSGYQFLIAQSQALIDMFAGTYLPDAYGETGIVQQDPPATEVKIDASKEEETSQGILERHACQFALLVGCCQRRVACKENLQAALAFIRAQEEAVKKKKILVPEQEYELITSIDTPENKAYLAEPDLGQADRAAD